MATVDKDTSSRVHFCPECRTSVQQKQEQCPKCKRTRPDSGWPVDRFIGKVVDNKYHVDSKLGMGGFAEVYLARQIQGEIDLGNVVLKFLHQALASRDSMRRRFINEARAARKLGSPHVVKVFDLGFDDDGLPYQVMEYLAGEGLEKILVRDKSLPPERVFRIGMQIASALEECHSLGIIHRDLKPDNVILLGGHSQDFIKVIDFGIARVLGDDGTATNTMIGTPRYMAPEQILEHDLDGGVDIFALGVTLYEALAGRSPITSSTPMGYLQENLNTMPKPLREAVPDMPKELETLLGRMMAKNRQDRPGSMAEVEMRLKAIGVRQGWVMGSRPDSQLHAGRLPSV